MDASGFRCRLEQVKAVLERNKEYLLDAKTMAKESFTTLSRVWDLHRDHNRNPIAITEGQLLAPGMIISECKRAINKLEAARPKFTRGRNQKDADGNPVSKRVTVPLDKGNFWVLDKLLGRPCYPVGVVESLPEAAVRDSPERGAARQARQQARKVQKAQRAPQQPSPPSETHSAGQEAPQVQHVQQPEVQQPQEALVQAQTEEDMLVQQQVQQVTEDWLQAFQQEPELDETALRVIQYLPTYSPPSETQTVEQNTPPVQYVQQPEVQQPQDTLAQAQTQEDMLVQQQAQQVNEDWLQEAQALTPEQDGTGLPGLEYLQLFTPPVEVSPQYPFAEEVLEEDPYAGRGYEPDYGMLADKFPELFWLRVEEEEQLKRGLQPHHKCY